MDQHLKYLLPLGFGQFNRALETLAAGDHTFKKKLAATYSLWRGESQVAQLGGVDLGTDAQTQISLPTACVGKQARGQDDLFRRQLGIDVAQAFAVDAGFGDRVRTIYALFFQVLDQ